jgi:simple sugar transport system permease protein
VTVFADRLPFARATWPRRIGVLGIALGAIAFWIALPPLKSRAVGLPILLGILAVACGIYAVTRRDRRVGWGAVAAGVLGIVLGILATHSSVGHLESVVTWSALIAAALRYATPLTFAAIGGLYSERSGVVNIGLEGMMLTGAFFGIWADVKSGSWIVGLLAAMAAGGAMALIHAFFAIQLRADQIVGGRWIAKNACTSAIRPPESIAIRSPPSQLPVLSAP